MGRACVQAILARCVARECASDSDWVTEADGVSYRAFPDGMLAKRKLGDDVDEWILSWCTSATIRPVDRGSLADIECSAREAILFGPPGGPNDGSGPRVWCTDEGSQFATAIHGSFRLMGRPDGRGTLYFVRDDHATLFLGDDSIEELKRSADRRLREHRGDPIRGWIGGRRFEFHGLGVGGVVGQFELMRDTRLMLARAGEDRYDLYMVVGRCVLDRIGSYTAAALASGDLGQLFDRRDVGAEESDRVSAAIQRPRRPPPHHGRAPDPHATRAPSLPRPATPSADQLGRVKTCFSRTGPFHGAGASDMAPLYAALRVLNTLNLPNMRVNTDEFQALVTGEGQAQLVGCTRTFIRAAERVLEETGFGARVGRWWDLPFADLRRLGPVLDGICARFEPTITSPNESTVSSTAASIPPPAASGSAAPAASPTLTPSTSPSTQPPAPPTPAASASSPAPAPPVSPTRPATTSIPTVSATSSPSAAPFTPRSGVPTKHTPAATAPLPVGETSRTTWTAPVTGVAASPAPPTAASNPEGPAPPVDVELPRETGPPEVGDDPTPDEPEDDGHWHPVLRRDGPTFYEPSISRDQPDDAPSRFKGAKPRGPPKT